MLVSLQQSCSFKGSRVSRIKDACFIAAKLQFQRFKGFMHQRCLFHCSKAAVSKVQEFHASKMLVSLQRSCSFKGSRVSRIKDACFIAAKLQFQRFKGFMHQRCLFHCSKAAVSKV
ncbi:MAG: hypothetical protein J6J29_05605, partial [Paludibacteraceae bacterium]|nr:hypothetical protein [Paludibacteraceae bacterium]